MTRSAGDAYPAAYRGRAPEPARRSGIAPRRSEGTRAVGEKISTADVDQDLRDLNAQLKEARRQQEEAEEEAAESWVTLQNGARESYSTLPIATKKKQIAIHPVLAEFQQIEDRLQLRWNVLGVLHSAGGRGVRAETESSPGVTRVDDSCGGG